MYKKILVVLFLFSLVQGANAQHVKVGYQIGLGTYSMNALKNINDQVLESLPFDSKVVDNFPGYLYFRPSVSLVFAGYSIGLIYTFQSTGSRISAKDFSGEYSFDTKVHSSAPGIYGDLKIFSKKKNTLCINSAAGILFYKLNTHESLTLQSSQVQNQVIDFKAQNFFMEPGLSYYYSMGSFCLGLNAGYFITIGNQAFYYGDINKTKLHDYKNQQDVKPDWNGIRAAFSISYTFGLKQ